MKNFTTMITIASAIIFPILLIEIGLIYCCNKSSAKKCCHKKCTAEQKVADDIMAETEDSMLDMSENMITSDMN